MDFFKFTSETDATTLDQGEAINGIDKSMWVERYATPGEFSFEAKISSGLMEFLPLGTLISHADTFDIMIVENHDVKEAVDKDSIITISGRSFLSALENRIVGTNRARATSLVTPYSLVEDFTWNQIVDLINDHIGNVTFIEDNLIDVVASSIVPGTSSLAARNIEFGPVLARVSELLKVDDLGIKTIRKNTFGVGIDGKTVYLVHGGVDRSADVLFSGQTGEIADIEYLFTNKSSKNAALVMGRYIWVVVDAGPIHYDKRTMLVQANDIDGNLDTIPTGSTLAAIITAMTTRGEQAIMGQSQITINQTDISNTVIYEYRRDFDIGDLVSIAGFTHPLTMRVVEYAEIEDENGKTEHPTLAIIGD